MNPKPQTIIYIDGSNLKQSAQSCGLNYDADLLIEYLKNKYHITEFKYFTPNFSFLHSEIEQMQKLGVKVILKNYYVENGKSKANCDVDIARHVTTDILLNKVDRVIILSGDGDFYPLFEDALNKDLKVKLIAIHPDHTSLLYKMGDKFGLTYLRRVENKIAKERPVQEVLQG